MDISNLALNLNKVSEDINDIDSNIQINIVNKLKNIGQGIDITEYTYWCIVMEKIYDNAKRIKQVEMDNKNDSLIYNATNELKQGERNAKLNPNETVINVDNANDYVENIDKGSDINDKSYSDLIQEQDSLVKLANNERIAYFGVGKLRDFIKDNVHTLNEKYGISLADNGAEKLEEELNNQYCIPEGKTIEDYSPEAIEKINETVHDINAEKFNTLQLWYNKIKDVEMDPEIRKMFEEFFNDPDGNQNYSIDDIEVLLNGYKNLDKNKIIGEIEETEALADDTPPISGNIEVYAAILNRLEELKKRVVQNEGDLEDIKNEIEELKEEIRKLQEIDKAQEDEIGEITEGSQADQYGGI